MKDVRSRAKIEFIKRVLREPGAHLPNAGIYVDESGKTQEVFTELANAGIVDVEGHRRYRPSDELQEAFSKFAESELEAWGLVK